MIARNKAKDQYDNWITGCILQLDDGLDVILPENKESEVSITRIPEQNSLTITGWIPIQNLTICVSTNVRSASGEEVFSDDILINKFTWDIYCVTEDEDTHCWWLAPYDPETEDFGDDEEYLDIEEACNMEIIGNLCDTYMKPKDVIGLIVENCEALKGTDDYFVYPQFGLGQNIELKVIRNPQKTEEFVINTLQHVRKGRDFRKTYHAIDTKCGKHTGQLEKILWKIYLRL